LNQNNQQPSEIWQFIKKHPFKIISSIIATGSLILTLQWNVSSNTDDIASNEMNIRIIRAVQQDYKVREAKMLVYMKNFNKLLEEVRDDVKKLRESK